MAPIHITEEGSAQCAIIKYAARTGKCQTYLGELRMERPGQFRFLLRDDC